MKVIRFKFNYQRWPTGLGLVAYTEKLKQVIRISDLGTEAGCENSISFIGVYINNLLKVSSVVSHFKEYDQRNYNFKILKNLSIGFYSFLKD